ncbi:unnamed protein product [Lasius platythorax]|uniref:Uncharacterized protein n=1 Tax=Lasius platythorax TaxID=488582 RepID=A0AAV2NZV6_9HYME
MTYSFCMDTISVTTARYQLQTPRNGKVTRSRQRVEDLPIVEACKSVSVTCSWMQPNVGAVTASILASD